MFESLEASGTRLLRGQLVLIAAGPGTGKSVLALTLALQSGVTCMYFSADSDAATQTARSISILMGWDMDRSMQAVLADELPQDVRESLAGLPIRFDYKASPTQDDLELSLQAYYEVFGAYPEMIVVDNGTNVRSDTGDGDPFSGLEALMDYLHEMARETEACVVVLHHVTGPFNDSDKPVPLSGIKGQIGRVPEMILTLHKRIGDYGTTDVLCVSTVKNRGGKADPSGFGLVELEFEGSRMRISDFSMDNYLTGDTT